MTLYNPFEEMDFHSDRCFLTGEKTNARSRGISVFPEWILERYNLHDQTLTMLGDNRVKYRDLKLPVSVQAFDACERLEKSIRQAFTNGYDAVRDLPELLLFQWMAKLMYGVLYHDFAYALESHKEKGKSFKLSPLMQDKLTKLHLLLQSVLVPMEFNGFVPWSIQVLNVNYSKDVFNYKDETHNLNFSLGMNGFGIVACLQDMGENNVFHQDIISKITALKLHPIQFEELYSRFMYSNYLLNRTAEWDMETQADKLVFKSVAFDPTISKPLFRKWEDKMYAQVLANYWKPWGLGTKDIVRFPHSPISYLVNEYTYEIIDPKSIRHPF
jgi:hypothetical protein